MGNRFTDGKYQLGVRFNADIDTRKRSYACRLTYCGWCKWAFSICGRALWRFCIRSLSAIGNARFSTALGGRPGRPVLRPTAPFLPYHCRKLAKCLRSEIQGASKPRRTSIGDAWAATFVAKLQGRMRPGGSSSGDARRQNANASRGTAPYKNTKPPHTQRLRQTRSRAVASAAALALGFPRRSAWAPSSKAYCTITALSCAPGAGIPPSWHYSPYSHNPTVGSR